MLPAPHASPTPRRLLALLLAATPLASCGSTPDAPESEPYVPPQISEPDSTGFLLAKLDNELRAWQNLKHTADSPREERTLRGLERQIAQEASKRQDDLLAELESRSRKNRAVAAVALGFTGDEAVIGPLLNALADPEEMVAHNALIGLAILGHESTPLGRITYLLENAEDGYTRVNAAFAISAVVDSGGGSDDVEPACLTALDDAEGGVRAQAATVLGRMGSTEAIAPLGDLLYDDEMLVTRAASMALAAIGLEHIEERGPIARLMVDAATRRKPTSRTVILLELRRLSSKDYGDSIEDWTDWAHRLP